MLRNSRNQFLIYNKRRVLKMKKLLIFGFTALMLLTACSAKATNNNENVTALIGNTYRYHAIIEDQIHDVLNEIDVFYLESIGFDEYKFNQTTWYFVNDTNHQEIITLDIFDADDTRAKEKNESITKDITDFVDIPNTNLFIDYKKGSGFKDTDVLYGLDDNDNLKRYVLADLVGAGNAATIDNLEALSKLITQDDSYKDSGIAFETFKGSFEESLITFNGIKVHPIDEGIPPVKSVTHVYDFLEITFVEGQEWTKVLDEKSEYYNKEVALVNVTIKNIAGKQHGLDMYSFDLYNPRGSKLPLLTSYFANTIIDSVELEYQEQKTYVLPVLYEGDGAYRIDFKKGNDEIQVFFDIYK